MKCDEFSMQKVVTRYDLDLWPLNLEHLYYFGRNVYEPCIKFERNRTICGRVIDDIAHLRPSIFICTFSGRFSGVRSSNLLWTQSDIAALKVYIRVEISCAVSKRGRLKIKWSQNWNSNCPPNGVLCCRQFSS